MHFKEGKRKGGGMRKVIGELNAVSDGQWDRGEKKAKRRVAP